MFHRGIEVPERRRPVTWWKREADGVTYTSRRALASSFARRSSKSKRRYPAGGHALDPQPRRPQRHAEESSGEKYFQEGRRQNAVSSTREMKKDEKRKKTHRVLLLPRPTADSGSCCLQEGNTAPQGFLKAAARRTDTQVVLKDYAVNAAHQYNPERRMTQCPQDCGAKIPGIPFGTAPAALCAESEAWLQCWTGLAGGVAAGGAGWVECSTALTPALSQWEREVCGPSPRPSPSGRGSVSALGEIVPTENR